MSAAMLHRPLLFLTILIAAAASAQPRVGKNWGIERRTYQDPATGIPITEITAPGTRSDNLYFHFSNFSTDNRYLLFVSDRSGGWQLFRADTTSGELVQLTDDPHVDARSTCVDPASPHQVYYLRGADVLRLDIVTLHAETIATIPPPALGGYGQCSPSGDGRWLAVSRQVDEKTWEIGAVDTTTGKYQTVIRQGFRIGHVQHSPTEPLIFYVWETGGYAPQRSWLVNRDGTANRPFYYSTDPKKWVTPLKEWMTHEAWVAGTGDMTMIQDKVGVVLVKSSGEWRVVREGDFWHCAARPDGKFIAIDDAKGRIWIVETATGNIRLLATGIRNVVPVHGHLSFDRTGRFIQFHSGRTHETIAVIDLNEVPAMRWVP